MATTSLLPLEIIEIILSKLPVKPLLRFKSVSKLWSALISDPVFIQNHHQKSISSNPHDLFLCNFSSPKKLCFVKLEDGNLRTLEENPKGVLRRYTHVVCYGEGVLLLTDKFFCSYVLFNPSTRTHTKLWTRFDISQMTCGLCKDPSTGDFKVFVVVNRQCYGVYSCKNKSWTYRKQIRNTGNGITLPVDWRNLGVSVNGAIYWVWRHNHTYAVIYFDPRDDTLKILPKPKDVDDWKMIFLVDLRSSLCLYCCGEDMRTVWIWTKEKGIDNHSWKELMTIHNVRNPIVSFLPQCFLGDKVLIRIRNDGELKVYCPSEKTFEPVGDMKLYGLRLIPYMDTLFSPITNTKRKRKRKDL